MWAIAVVGVACGARRGGAVALVLARSVIVLGERPGAGALGGLVAILAGSWLVTGGGVPRRLPRRRGGGVGERDPQADSAGA